MNLTMTVNLTTLSLEDLHALKVAIDGEFARRTGKSVTVSRGCERRAPRDVGRAPGGRQERRRQGARLHGERLPGEPRLDHAGLTGIRG